MATSDKDMRIDFKGYIRDVLSGDSLNNALAFADFLQANDMQPGGQHGAIEYQNQCLCYMHIVGSDQMPGPWTVWTDGVYSEEDPAVPMNDQLKAIAWAHVNHCANCGGGCNPGTNKLILGRPFEGVCSANMAFTDPDPEALKCLEKLLLMRKLSFGN